MDYRWIKALKTASWIIFIMAALLAISLTIYGIVHTGNILVGVVYLLAIGGTATLGHCFMMIFAQIAVKILDITPDDIPIEYEFEESNLSEDESEQTQSEQKIPGIAPNDINESEQKIPLE
jgi:hypothetical protein